MAATRRVNPLVSLNPYLLAWTVKVRVTNKGNLNPYKDLKREGFVFTVELTDEDGTQMNAIMFNEAAQKFYPRFEVGRFYYISKGTIRNVNEKFKTVQNNYEMNLDEQSIIEDADGECSSFHEIIAVNPDLPEAKKLRTWYDSKGKGTAMAPVSSGLSYTGKNASMSMHSDRVFLSHITNDPTLGQDKAVSFFVNAYISCIKSENALLFRACNTCNQKITEAIGSGYWCEGCQKNVEASNLKFELTIKVCDASGESWITVFDENAEKVIGCTVNELFRIKNEEGDVKYQLRLNEAIWDRLLFRVRVTQTEYMNKKKQKITVEDQSPIEYSDEMRLLLKEIEMMSS